MYKEAMMLAFRAIESNSTARHSDELQVVIVCNQNVLITSFTSSPEKMHAWDRASCQSAKPKSTAG